MTKLTKPVSREVAVPMRGAIVVTLTLHAIVFRRKGTRMRWTLPYGSAIHRAEWLAADAIRARKNLARTSRRRASA